MKYFKKSIKNLLFEEVNLEEPEKSSEKEMRSHFDDLDLEIDESILDDFYIAMEMLDDAKEQAREEAEALNKTLAEKSNPKEEAQEIAQDLKQDQQELDKIEDKVENEIESIVKKDPSEEIEEKKNIFDEFTKWQNSFNDDVYSMFEHHTKKGYQTWTAALQKGDWATGGKAMTHLNNIQEISNETTSFLSGLLPMLYNKFDASLEDFKISAEFLKKEIEKIPPQIAKAIKGGTPFESQKFLDSLKNTLKEGKASNLLHKYTLTKLLG